MTIFFLLCSCHSPELPLHPSITQQITRYKAQFQRNEYTAHLANGQKCKIKVVQFCTCHSSESELFLIYVPIVIDGTSRIINEFIMFLDLPFPHGQKHFKSPPTSISKGISADQLVAGANHEWSYMPGCPSSLWQTVEMTVIHIGEQQLGDINPNVCKATGLSVHERKKQSKQPTEKRIAKQFCSMKVAKKMKGKKESYKNYLRIYKMQNLIPEQVCLKNWVFLKQNTDFCNLRELLCFVAIVCNGDFNKMTKWGSYLSWLEEWLFYFQMIYGHGMVWWCDYAEKYKILQYILCRVFQKKLAIVVESQQQ